MENIFSIARFWNQLQSDLKKSWRNMSFSFLLMSCTGAITYLFVLGLRWLLHWEYFTLTLESRALIYGIMMSTLCIVTPARCFGSITQLKEGRFYLQIPSSALEKALSMILIGAIIVPLSASCIYLGWDALICLDPTCGSPLASSLGIELNILAQFIPFSLAFLLGAVYFKKSKMAKTIGCILLLSLLSGILVGPFLDMEALYLRYLNVESTGLPIESILPSLVLSGLIYWRVRTLQP